MAGDGGGERRGYRMVARARGVAATRERILDAAVAAFWASPKGRPSLDDVAVGAGVSVQTVLRHFGSAEGLFAAAVERETAKVAADREVAAVCGDPDNAVRQLVDHYEEYGDGVVRMLAEETRQPALAVVAQRGRQFHRDWCEAVFAAELEGLSTADRARRLAALVAVCDVYTWQLLRRVSGLSRPETERAMRELVGALTGGT